MEVAGPRSPFRSVTIVSGGAERAQRDPGRGGFVRGCPGRGAAVVAGEGAEDRGGERDGARP